MQFGPHPGVAGSGKGELGVAASFLPDRLASQSLDGVSPSAGNSVLQKCRQCGEPRGTGDEELVSARCGAPVHRRCLIVHLRNCASCLRLAANPPPNPQATGELHESEIQNDDSHPRQGMRWAYDDQEPGEDMEEEAPEVDETVEEAPMTFVQSHLTTQPISEGTNNLDVVYEILAELCCDGLWQGDAVVLTGLQKEPSLNGKKGFIDLGHSNIQRMAVQLEGEGRKLVKPANLLACSFKWTDLEWIIEAAEDDGLTASEVQEAVLTWDALKVFEFDRASSRVRFIVPFAHTVGRIE